MTRLAEFALRIAPARLRGPVGQKLIYALAMPADGIVEWCFQGVKARFPLVGTPTAHGAIGRDRGIRKGPAQSDESYAQQLVRWLDDWRTAGSTWAMLDQLAAFFAPSPPRMRVVSSNGSVALWYTREPDGTRSKFVASPSNWDWDGQTRRARSFVLIDMSAGPWTEAPLWGVPTWGDGTVWGVNVSLGDVEGVRQIVDDWGAAHVLHPYIIVYFDASKFDPTGSGSDYPDGTWGDEYKLVGGVVTPTRPAWARFIPGPGGA